MSNEVMLLSSDINIITAEINSYKQKAGKAIYEIGVRQLGKSATLKQIANHVAPQLDLNKNDALIFMLAVQSGVNS